MQPAKQQKCPTYQRRRPELTPCYKILQDHLATFIAEREAEGRPLPDYVLEEFDAYLRCGIPAHGFLRLKCTGCSEEKIVAFSCKKRGFCPSCCARRMAEASAHLVGNVLPYVAYRQFVISFPIPLRYWLQTNKDLYSKIHAIIIKHIHRYYKMKAEGIGIKEPTPGSISFTQRWGSALNLNPHMHVICPDGVYTMVNDKPKFNNIEPITDEQVATLITKASSEVMRLLKKRGHLDQEGEVVENPMADELFAEHESVAMATQSSIAGRIAFGPNAGKYVTRIGSGFGYGEEIPLAKGQRCYSINGFSLHANTAVKPQQRNQLAKLIEYVARGPLSNERLVLTEDGQVKLQLKTPWSDGTSHLLFTPSEFIEKLCALIPPPKAHLVRWAGCFAPNSPYRKLITLKPEVKKGFQFADEDSDHKIINYTWSKMLAKVFKVDVTKCACGGDLLPVCAVTERDSIKRYLEHSGIDSDPPQQAPPRRQQESFAFQDQDPSQDDCPVIELD